MITAPPAQTLVCSSTRLTVDSYRFFAKFIHLKPIILTLVNNRSLKPKPLELVNNRSPTPKPLVNNDYLNPNPCY